ncbi:hypothetical protein RPYSC3_37540 [Rhodopseudomonas palustris]|nr:hypothetical protein RPYSC3_37540 [Rhodopseudomonas palustris]
MQRALWDTGSPGWLYGPGDDGGKSGERVRDREACRELRLELRCSDSACQTAMPLRSRGSAEPELCARRRHDEGRGRAAWRKVGGWSRWLAIHRASPSRRAHQRRSFGIGTVLPGAGSTGISPASFRPVQPREGQPLIVAADGDLLPPGRRGCEPHRAGRRVRLGAAAPCSFAKPSPAGLPADDLSRFQAPSRSAPHGQDGTDYSPYRNIVKTGFANTGVATGRCPIA